MMKSPDLSQKMEPWTIATDVALLAGLAPPRPDCLEVLDQAKDMVELNVQEDPHYHIADNKLG